MKWRLFVAEWRNSAAPHFVMLCLCAAGIFLCHFFSPYESLMWVVFPLAILIPFTAFGATDKSRKKRLATIACLPMPRWFSAASRYLFLAVYSVLFVLALDAVTVWAESAGFDRSSSGRVVLSGVVPWMLAWTLASIGWQCLASVARRLNFVADVLAHLAVAGCAFGLMPKVSDSPYFLLSACSAAAILELELFRRRREFV